MRRTISWIGGARAFTLVGFAVILAGMLWFAATAPPTTMSSSAAFAQYHPGPSDRSTLRANLTTEVPGPGDPDGSGNAMLKVYKAKVCYKLSVRGIKPATMAHIHKGAKGQTGPIVVPTDQSSFNLPRPTSSGCEAVPPALSMKLRQNPSNYYVNVHNKPYPDGAIRGQLRMMMGM